MPSVAGTRELGIGLGWGGTGGGALFWASPSMIVAVVGVARFATWSDVQAALNPPLDHSPKASKTLMYVNFFLITTAIAIIKPTS